MRGDDPAISATGLTKRYGDHQALAGLDLTVERGEVFAVLGPNGAGKTTSVEILEGFRRRDAGHVRVLGVDPAHAPLSWRARIGIVAQSGEDRPELTVSELVRHVAGLYPHPAEPDEVIAAVGLEAKRRARVRSLSGGQRRRLDVALGIVGRPKLLFLDEPTTGFDPEARREFWELISGLRIDGVTILLTTHYLDEAKVLADRVGVVAAGRMIQVATPDRLGTEEMRTPVVRWIEGGRAHELRTGEPTRAVTDLAARLGDEVPELEVIRPSLEDVYLAMIREATR